MRKIFDQLFLLVMVYTVGLLLALLFLLFKVFKVIKISHPERLPYKQGNLIVISNHPSLLEPILLPVMFYREYLRHPFRLTPWSTPDKKNFGGRFWLWAKPRMIPVDRNNNDEALKTFSMMKKVVNTNGILILFGEGGRTFKGERFLYSQRGKRIRVLEKGIALLTLKTSAEILPIWVEGTDNFFPNTLWIDDKESSFPLPRFWKKITIKVGKPIKFENRGSKEVIIQEIAATLLELADEPCAF